MQAWVWISVFVDPKISKSKRECSSCGECYPCSRQRRLVGLCLCVCVFVRERERERVGLSNKNRALIVLNENIIRCATIFLWWVFLAQSEIISKIVFVCRRDFFETRDLGIDPKKSRPRNFDRNPRKWTSGKIRCLKVKPPLSFNFSFIIQSAEFSRSLSRWRKG